MPFMPQMFQYCGKRFRVYKRAHKTCDTIVWNWDSPGRKLPDGIHLNLRCDGKAYGGCQAACLIFWKEAWLKPCDGDAKLERPSVAAGSCSEADVERATRADDPKAGGEARLCLPGDRAPQFHAAAAVVGCKAILGRLHIRKCNAWPDAARFSLQRLLLRQPLLRAKTRRPVPLALRPRPGARGAASPSLDTGGRFLRVVPRRRPRSTSRPGTSSG